MSIPARVVTQLQRWSRSPIALALIGVLAVATVLRVVALRSDALRFDADEAVTGVMAQRILEGDHFAFFAGQDYMGTLEQYLQALVLALTPDTVSWLRMVPLVLSVVACALVFAVGRRLLGSPWAALAAAAIFAVGPYYNLTKGVLSHGAYASALVLSLVLILLAVRFDPQGRRAAATAFVIGLLAGAAIWQSLLAAYLVLPALVWVVGSARGQLRALLPFGLAGGVIGALPLLASRLSGGSLMGDGPALQPPSTYADRMGGLLDPVGAMFLGVQRISPPVAVSEHLAPAAVVIIALVALGAGLWQHRVSLWRLVTLRPDGRDPFDLVLLSLALGIVLYGLSSYTWFTGEPRYLFTLYPALALALAGALARAGRAAVPATAVALVLLMALTAVQLRDAARADGFPPISGGGPVHSEDAAAVVAAARERGLEALWADYWLAYPLQFAAGDRLAVAALSNDRFPGRLRAVANTEPPAGIVTPQGQGAERMAAALTALGVEFRQLDVGRATLFHGLSRSVGAQELVGAGACALASCG